jgi:hypothetical protein
MQKAQKAADNVVTWQHLNKAWKDYRQCDTGEVSETFTESILRLMIEWKNIDALAEGMKDPEYASFIQTHLKSPAAQNDVKDVRSRATQSCPKGQSDGVQADRLRHGGRQAAGPLADGAHPDRRDK